MIKLESTYGTAPRWARQVTSGVQAIPSARPVEYSSAWSFACQSCGSRLTVEERFASLPTVPFTVHRTGVRCGACGVSYTVVITVTDLGETFGKS